MAEDASAPEITITPDGGVTKVVLREGTGDPPPKHSRCLVHYVGTLREGGEAFMDTRAESESHEPVQVVAGRDSVMRDVGLNLGVATMRKGELCRLRVAPKYGYGERGNFSFPTVPPNAELEYEVELVDWEAPDDEREPRLLTYEERLEAAERRRQQGNELFRQGDLEAALSKYRLALSYLDEDLLLQLDGFFLDRAQAVRAPALLNMAAVQLKQEDYHAAVITCNQALAAEPGSAKALFRRGRARHLLGQTEAAFDDLQEARKAAPSDAAVLQELQAVKAKLREEKKAQGQLFKGYFDKAGAQQQLYEESDAAAAGSPGPTAPATPGGGSSSGGGAQVAQQAVAQALGGWWAAAWGWLRQLLSALFPSLFHKAHAA